jgi:large-conductance mechanosensitive channel
MKKIVVAALIGGLVITLITGLVNTTPQDLVGATWYGWPLAWRIIPVVLQPQASYKIGEFVGNVIIWFVVVFVILFILKKLRKK